MPYEESSGSHGGGDARMINSFLDSIENNKTPLADGEAGYWSIAIGEAAEESVEY